jgi:hypothetical protein
MTVSSPKKPGLPSTTHPQFNDKVKETLERIMGRRGSKTGTQSSITDPEWFVVSDYANTWTAYTTGDYGVGAEYAKIGGFVHLRGTVQNGADNELVFTLPEGFRPNKVHEFYNSTLGERTSWEVRVNGEVWTDNIGPSGLATFDGSLFWLGTNETPDAHQDLWTRMNNAINSLVRQIED